MDQVEQLQGSAQSKVAALLDGRDGAIRERRAVVGGERVDGAHERRGGRPELRLQHRLVVVVGRHLRGVRVVGRDRAAVQDHQAEPHARVRGIVEERVDGRLRDRHLRN